jgi:hypothetical protein
MEFLKPYVVYGFLGFLAENLKNWNDDTFTSCNPIIRWITDSRKWCLFPFPPAYGIGGVCIAIMWTWSISIWWKLLLMAVGFNVIELVGGLVGEHAICKHMDTCHSGTKMWDYSRTPNLGGYIDLEHTFYWVLLGAVGYGIYPWLMKLSAAKLGTGMIVLYVLVTLFKPYKEPKLE